MNMRATSLLLMLTACGGNPFIAFDDAGEDAPAEASVPEGDAQDSGGAESEAADGDAADDTRATDAGSETGTDDAPIEAGDSGDASEEPPPVCLGDSCSAQNLTCCSGAFCHTPDYKCVTCLPLGHYCVLSEWCCSGSCQFSMCN